MTLPFPVNPTRLDPYKNFIFRLKWDGKYVYGGSKLTGLKLRRYADSGTSWCRCRLARGRWHCRC